MATACIAHSTLRVHGISKPIVARFDQPHASSDGGAVLVKAVDDRLGLTVRLASAVRDRRQPGKIAHRLRDLVRQRVFGLACGYADCNDAAQLAHDPIHKLLLERDPLDGPALGSQPTLSRFENAVARPDLYRLGSALADTMLVYHHERLGPDVRLITVDLDATDDPTHGQQEFALFNGYYDTWCYLPLVATVTFNTDPLQYLLEALLQPGTGAATRGVRRLGRPRSTRGCTAAGATWRIGSKNCSTGWPWTARVARASRPTNSVCCSPRQPISRAKCCRPTRALRPSVPPRSRRCASDC